MLTLQEATHHNMVTRSSVVQRQVPQRLPQLTGFFPKLLSQKQPMVLTSLSYLKLLRHHLRHWDSSLTIQNEDEPNKENSNHHS